MNVPDTAHAMDPAPVHSHCPGLKGVECCFCQMPGLEFNSIQVDMGTDNM